MRQQPERRQWGQIWAQEEEAESSHSQLTFPRWPLGTQPKQLPLPQAPWEVVLEGYSGKWSRGKGAMAKQSEYSAEVNPAPVRSAHLSDRRNQEKNFQESTRTSFPPPTLIPSSCNHHRVRCQDTGQGHRASLSSQFQDGMGREKRRGEIRSQSLKLLRQS